MNSLFKIDHVTQDATMHTEVYKYLCCKVAKHIVDNVATFKLANQANHRIVDVDLTFYWNGKGSLGEYGHYELVPNGVTEDNIKFITKEMQILQDALQYYRDVKQMVESITGPILDAERKIKEYEARIVSLNETIAGLHTQYNALVKECQQLRAEREDAPTGEKEIKETVTKQRGRPRKTVLNND